MINGTETSNDWLSTQARSGKNHFKWKVEFGNPNPPCSYGRQRSPRGSFSPEKVNPIVLFSLIPNLSTITLLVIVVVFHHRKGGKDRESETGRLIMATLRQLKIKTGTSKRVLKELHSYEKEVEDEAAKTADMKGKGVDPYDLKQQENVLAESRMMIPDCLKRLEASLVDLKATLEEVKESSQEGPEITEAESTILELEPLFQTEED